MITVTRDTFALARTFTISRGSKTAAHVLTVRVTRGGVTGWGECVPYARYGSSLDSDTALILDLPPSITRADLQHALPPGTARNAVDCALWDLEAKQAGRPVWALAGLPEPRPVPVAFTLSLDTPEDMRAQAAANAHRSLLKIKLGTPDDMPRLEAVRAGAPNATLIIDANEGWTPEVYTDLAPHLLRLGVAMVEQPLPAGADDMLAEIARPLPVCADESAHGAASLSALHGKYDLVNLKLDKTGGLTEALAAKVEAQRLGLGLMVGCMVGSSLAMAPAVLVAQGARFCDLDGPLLLSQDRPDPLHYDAAGVHPCHCRPVGLTPKGHTMPTSKKPRKGRAAPPKKSALDQVLDDMSDAMNMGDLDLFDQLHGELRRIALGDTALDAEFFAHIAELRAELVGSIAIADDVQAALWVGDMKRVQELEEANLPITGAPDDDDDDDLEDYFAATDPYADLAEGKPGAVEALLASGLALDTLGGPEERPALFAALEAPGRNAATVQKLLDAGADAGEVLDDGASVLSWALMYDHYDSVTPDSEKTLFDLLIAGGAEPNGASEDFGTNLIAAIIMGDVPQVASLLQAGADLNVRAPDDFQLSTLAGATPVMLAAPKPDVLRLLLAHGASPTERDEDGRTPREVIHDAATAARARVKDDWSRAHADALEQSLSIIRAALN